MEALLFRKPLLQAWGIWDLCKVGHLKSHISDMALWLPSMGSFLLSGRHLGILLILQSVTGISIYHDEPPPTALVLRYEIRWTLLPHISVAVCSFGCSVVLSVKQTILNMLLWHGSIVYSTAQAFSGNIYCETEIFPANNLTSHLKTTLYEPLLPQNRTISVAWPYRHWQNWAIFSQKPSKIPKYSEKWE